MSRIAKLIEEATGQPVTVVTCSATMTPQQLLGGLVPVGESHWEFLPSHLLQALQAGDTVVLDEYDCLPGDVYLTLVGLASAFPGATIFGAVRGKYIGREAFDAVTRQYIVVVSQ